MSAPTAAELGRPRWDGTPHRLEVWYTTVTDRETGAGLWIHYETVAPDAGDARAHGWVSWFPAGARPVTERFGPVPVQPARATEHWFDADGCSLSAGRARGAAGSITWDLGFEGGGDPLYTFPRALWERELLPGAQIVPWPDARFTGTLTVDGTAHTLDGRGNLARIFGHGNAQRWGWLHADLGDGAVLEVVAATARRPTMRGLPPAPVLRLRLPGEPDWPANPIAALARLRAGVDLPRWWVRGVVGRRRLRVDVDQPLDRCVALRYEDPDGATATCTNTERADVTVVLDEWSDRGWRTAHEWRLDGTGHAEVGLRP